MKDNVQFILSRSLTAIAWVRSLASNAIIGGMLIGNFIPLPKVFAEGVSSYEFFLKEFLITDVARLGGIGLAIVVVEVLFSIGFVNLFSGGSSFLKS
jgi:hypothetical protein